jgi:phosphoribosylformimino-5-aminoimidazole carboxamide ribotide isomerase
MQIWPAIDLRGGKCVRLRQGDFQRERVFGDDPAAMARHWVAQGARQLHVVDLDGARDGRQANVDAIHAIVAASGVPCQVGGGIRTDADCQQLLSIGVARLVVATAAVRDPGWFRRTCRTHPGRLVLQVDVRDGCLATQGWLDQSSISAVEFAGQFAKEPLAAVVYTDIARDGMLAGPNLEALAAVRPAVRGPLIASGGVRSLDDIRNLAAVPVEECILGLALYEGTLQLADALAAANENPTMTGAHERESTKAAIP